LLSQAPCQWSAVTVGLIDERWVAPSHRDSNERLVRTHLLRGPAGAAGFVPMYTFDGAAAAAEADRDAAYGPHCTPPGLILLGMGTDGHTASWFPRCDGLQQLVDPGQSGILAAVTAPLATVPERMTLTGRAILNARRAILLVFGDEKRSVLLASSGVDPLDCPVRFAVEGLGDRLSIFWAP
jgi:6-phosphogluconolactonase